MKTTILQLEAHDDVISTRDKMTWSKTPRILLVWPRRGKILQRKVDLVLLKRQGQQSGAQIALVTRDTQVTAYAQEVGIPVFSNTRQAQRRTWSAAERSGLIIPKDRSPLDPANLRAQREGIRPAVNPVWQNPVLRLVIFLAGVLSVLALAAFFYPTGEVRFSPARVEQHISLPLRAGPEILTASPSGDLPAEWVTTVVEATRESPTTGMVSAPDAYARGRVRFSNLTTGAVRVPAGLVVRTLQDPPLRFAVLETVDVPAGVNQSAEAAVRALQAGSESNVPVGSILAMDGDLGLRLTVSNPDVLAGGTERLAGSPSADDVQRLREVVLQDLQSLAITELTAGLETGQELLAGSTQMGKILAEEAQPAVGQAADQFSLHLEVEYRALVIQTADLEQIARAGLDANLPAGFHAVTEDLRIQPEGDPSFDAGGEMLAWQVRVDRLVEASWTSEGVTQAVLGRRRSEAADALKQSVILQGEPQIRVAPEWWQRMPYLAFRITVVAQ